MKTLKSDQGFTLVELMVVVAIIGVLAAVAIPNFKTYQAKAKTTEAKLQLAAAYAAEVSFQGDADSYANCLGAMGYNPSNEAPNRYYSVGITVADGVTRDGTNINGAACAADASAANITFFLAGKSSNASTAAATFITRSAVNATTFTIEAAGHINPSGTANATTVTDMDSWTIDQNKSVVHAQLGY